MSRCEPFSPSVFIDSFDDWIECNIDERLCNSSESFRIRSRSPTPDHAIMERRSMGNSESGRIIQCESEGNTSVVKCASESSTKRRYSRQTSSDSSCFDIPCGQKRFKTSNSVLEKEGVDERKVVEGTSSVPGAEIQAFLGEWLEEIRDEGIEFIGNNSCDENVRGTRSECDELSTTPNSSVRRDGFGDGLANNSEQRTRATRDISSERTNEKQRVITTQNELLQKLKSVNKKSRVVHDIFDVRRPDQYNYVISKLTNIIKFENGFIIAYYHPLDNFEHLHLIHNCNYSNGCRCGFLRNIKVKKRTYKSTKLLYTVTDGFLQNLLHYLTQDGYEFIVLVIDGEKWTMADQISGNLVVIIVIRQISYDY